MTFKLISKECIGLNQLKRQECGLGVPSREHRTWEGLEEGENMLEELKESQIAEAQR